jgi:dCMP deaminase
MKFNLRKLYMDIASRVATESHCTRRQVGAVITTSDGLNVLSLGYNGTPSGYPNICEDINGLTIPTVLHAELNAIAKCAALGHSTHGATMFVTLSPCINCSLLILQSGIKNLYYLDRYKCTSGIDLLTASDVKVQQFKQ